MVMGPLFETQYNSSTNKHFLRNTADVLNKTDNT